MTDTTAVEVETAEKAGKKGLVLWLILAIAGAAGGYFVTSAGLLPIGGKAAHQTAPEGKENKGVEAMPEVAFIDLPAVIVSVKAGDSRHLKFHAQLEVNAKYAADVEQLQPRIMDVMNSYLRAVELSDLDDSLALIRIRGHLLRRIGIVVGESRVRDVLVSEFVLN